MQFIFLQFRRPEVQNQFQHAGRASFPPEALQENLFPLPDSRAAFLGS